MDDTRPFPIQQDRKRNNKGEMEFLASCTIPWWLAQEAYEYYVSQYGNSQTLERLAERGGFGREELLGLIRKTL